MKRNAPTLNLNYLFNFFKIVRIINRFLETINMAAPEISEADQIKTFKDFLVQYNKLSELCFSDCIHDFTSRTIRNTEDKCILNCMEKYLRANQRVSQRFHEFQMIANENMLALAQKSGNPS